MLSNLAYLKDSEKIVDRGKSVEKKKIVMAKKKSLSLERASAPRGN